MDKMIETSAIREKSPKSIASVIKAVDILEQIAGYSSGLGVTEVSQKLGFGVSATYHLLSTLKMCNMLVQDDGTKKYYIGPAVFRIGGQAMNQSLTGSIAISFLNALREEIDETCSLSVLEGCNVICVAQSESMRMVRTFAKPGVLNPFYYTAGGKIMVASQARENWDALISHIRFEKYTKNTILSVRDLVKELELTKERGYGLDNEEREEGVICIAAPVYNSYGEAIAAMSVSGPMYRIKDSVDNIAQTIIPVALEFSKYLGYKL